MEAREASPRLYLNWLDGWHRRLALEASGQRLGVSSGLVAEPDKWGVRIIKLHALVGDTIALTEPQIVDSPVIASLFADADFRRFLSRLDTLTAEEKDSRQPRLFELVVDPPPEDPVAWYKAPLYSLLRAGWQCTPLHSPRAGLMLAQRLVDADSFENVANDFLGRIARRRDRFMLEGIIRASLYFFEQADDAIKLPTGPTRGQYYARLKALRDEVNLRGEHRRAVEDLVRLLDHLDQAARDSRTRLFEALSREGFEKHRADFSTVIDAWNLAVREGVASGGATAMLASGVPVSHYLSSPVGFVGPSWVPPGTTTESTSFAQIDGLGARILQADPTSLTWSSLGELIERTSETRRDLALARRSSDKARRRSAEGKHFEAIARQMPALRAKGLGVVWSGLMGIVFDLEPGAVAAIGAAIELAGQLADDYRPDVALLERMRQRKVVTLLQKLHRGHANGESGR